MGESPYELLSAAVCGRSATPATTQGQPATVIRGWERYRVALMYDEQMDRYGYYAEGSSSAFDSVYETGLAGENMAAWDDPNGEEISETEAEALIDQWRIQRIELTMYPMSEWSGEAAEAQ